MTSTSFNGTASDIRRHRASRFSVSSFQKYKPPSFSLGVDLDAVTALSSSDESSRTNLRGDKEKKTWDFLRQSTVIQADNGDNGCSGNDQNGLFNYLKNGTKEVDTVKSLDLFDECAKLNLSRGEEEKSWKQLEPSSFVQIDGCEGSCFQSGNDQKSVLKRGPTPVRKEVLGDDRDLWSRKDASQCRLNKEYAGPNVNLLKDNLSSIDDLQTQVPEDIQFSDSTFGFRLGGVQAADEHIGLATGLNHKVGHRLNQGPLLVRGETSKWHRGCVFSGDVLKCTLEEAGRYTGGCIKVGKQLQGNCLTTHVPHTTQLSSRLDVDEIEEFSEDETFASGPAQGNCGAPRPQHFESNPTIINLSSDTSEKPLLHFLGADQQLTVTKVPLEIYHSTAGESPVSDDVEFWHGDLNSTSDWRASTGLNFSCSAHSSQQNKKASLTSSRTVSVLNLSTSSGYDSTIKSNVRGLHVQIPPKRDIGGASEALGNCDSRQTDKCRIAAFLSERLQHYKPIDALLVEGGFDKEPVFIDYRKQFVDCEGKSSPGRSGNAGARRQGENTSSIALSGTPLSATVAQRQTVGKRNLMVGAQARKKKSGNMLASSVQNVPPAQQGLRGSGEGKWRTVNGSRVYILGGRKMRGRHAYTAYKKAGGKRTKKKSGKDATIK